MALRSRLLVLVFVLVASLVFAACSGGDKPSVADPPASAATSTAGRAAASPAPPPARQGGSAPAEPDGGQILEDVRHLSETIGARPAGSSTEEQAAEFIAGRLREYGYEVSLQEFPIATEISRDSRLVVQSAGGESSTVAALPLEQSGSGSVRANLVLAGRGLPADFPASTRGSIALIERGDLRFVDKIANAQRAGAAAAVVYNNEAGIFFGSLGSQASIPAISISQTDGQLLVERLRAGTLEASVSVAPPGTGTSQNVVARPPGKECETVTGGHYDSVPQAPGASDNATGSATVLAIAGVIAGRGEMGANCFVLFGAEELGLLGSKAFVSALTTEQRQALKAMFNYDMVGVGTEGWLLLGSAGLQDRAAGLAQSLGISAARGNLPSNSSSDHASFLAAGLPAFMLYRLDDQLLHTPQDIVAGRVDPALLEQAARLGVALIESMSRGS